MLNVVLKKNFRGRGYGIDFHELNFASLWCENLFTLLRFFSLAGQITNKFKYLDLIPPCVSKYILLWLVMWLELVQYCKRR